MGATVYTTEGGTRYHFDRRCYALANGREFHAAHAGWEEAGGLYPLRTRSNLGAALAGFTACRVCVPPRFALPVSGEDYGHRPIIETGYYGPEQVCARCHLPGLPMLSQPWPCMSAAVICLVVTDADRWNARYGVGTPVVAYPLSRSDEPLRTRTRTPAWRIGDGASVVSVDGYAGGIALTHVDPS